MPDPDFVAAYLFVVLLELVDDHLDQEALRPRLQELSEELRRIYLSNE